MLLLVAVYVPDVRRYHDLKSLGLQFARAKLVVGIEVLIFVCKTHSRYLPFKNCFDHCEKRLI